MVNFGNLKLMFLSLFKKSWNFGGVRVFQRSHLCDEEIGHLVEILTACAELTGKFLHIISSITPPDHPLNLSFYRLFFREFRAI